MNDRVGKTQGERGLYTAGVHSASHWHPDGEAQPGFVRTYARAEGTAAPAPLQPGRWWWALIAGPRALAGDYVETREQAQTECDAAAERHGVA